jgi:hypothetical protein
MSLSSFAFDKKGLVFNDNDKMSQTGCKEGSTIAGRGMSLNTPFYLLKGEGRSAERVSANPASLLVAAALATTYESKIRQTVRQDFNRNSTIRRDSMVGGRSPVRQISY